jgi:repressor LexA
MPEVLTKRQRAILDFISLSIDERGFPPTLREIGEHFGIRSTNGVNDHLKALEKKGYLRREDLKSRAMRPMTPDHQDLPDNVVPLRRPAPVPSPQFCDVPIVGRVAAGQPILAVENVEDTVRIDRMLIGPHREVFGLRVVGESMIEDGIFDGDYVFVQKSPTANPGDIVVAMIDEEATVKRYYPEGDRIRFQPANAAMQPIMVHRSDFKSVDLIGTVVGVYRKL